MTRLEVLKAAGLFDEVSDEEGIEKLTDGFSCPGSANCIIGYSCDDCWRKWLEEEVKLQ